MVEDAEGATKMIEAQVDGAASPEDARKAAREIISSVGVKTAIYGHDANWGRILSAIGNSGAAGGEDKVTLRLCDANGRGEVRALRGRSTADLRSGGGEGLPCAARGLDPRRLGLGDGEATAWGTDLTDEFVRLNSVYTT